MGSFITPVLNSGCYCDDYEVAVENHGLFQTENTVNFCESTEQDIPDISMTSSKNTSVSDNYSVGLFESTKSTKISNNVSNKIGIGTLDRYVDRLVNIQEQVRLLFL